MARLILVEGIPGSGKSTTAKYIKSYLEKSQEPVKLFLEGTLDHPADYDQVAALHEAEFNQLKKDYPESASFLQQESQQQLDFHLLSYGKWELGAVPESLLNKVRDYDIYDGQRSAEEHQSLLIKHWERFAGFHGRESGVYIFECAFLQNPLCALMARHNLPVENIIQHITALEKAVEGMQPIMVYLDAKNPRETLEKVSKERSEEWLDFVIRYHSSQGYGESRGLQGFDGLITFMEERQKIECHAINHLQMPVLSLEITKDNWEQHHNQIGTFIDTHIK